MPVLLLDLLLLFAALGAGIAVFFFLLTRGALMLRSMVPGDGDPGSHIYPIYTDMRLIRLIDYQVIVSAILLFQYRRLVSEIATAIRHRDLRGKTVLITSCAFGNVIPEIVSAARSAGAARMLVCDIVANELIHARIKLGGLGDGVEFIEEDATVLPLAEGEVDVNVMFFLLHELPHTLKDRALDEAVRVIGDDGVFYLAEFHRPDSILLRPLSWLYFKIFEPYGLALWGSHDPVACLRTRGGWACQRSTCCLGNFQVITAIRSGDN